MCQLSALYAASHAMQLIEPWVQPKTNLILSFHLDSFRGLTTEISSCCAHVKLPVVDYQVLPVL